MVPCVVQHGDVGREHIPIRKCTHLYMLLVVEAKPERERERERERENFDFVAPFYILLWSRHLAAIRGTILETRDVING